MRLMKPVAILAGLLVAVASASPALARDGHGHKHWKHWKHHHHHPHYVGPPARFLSAPVVVERPVIYRSVPADYGYYGPPPLPSLNLNIPLR